MNRTPNPADEQSTRRNADERAAEATATGIPNFPADFVWGTATSAYQIEGTTSGEGRGASIWDTFCARPGTIVDGSDGSHACESYARWEPDLDLIRDLGYAAYRFSVSWPRVMPAGTGRVNQAGLDHYERLVDGMLERSLVPFATLYHWDLPQALEDRGGWTARATALAFADYSAAVVERLGDRVASYATLNEPWCSAFLGYEYGEHAPGIRDQQARQRAVHHLLLAHGLALPRMRAAAPRADHGIVLNFTPAYPLRPSDPRDLAAVTRHDATNHQVFLGPLTRGEYPPEVLANASGAGYPIEDGDMQVIAAPIDFLGVNYYTRCVVSSAEPAPGAAEAAWPGVTTHPVPAAAHTAMGWEIYPRGLRDLLLALQQQTDLPLYVTENGAAMPDTSITDGLVADHDRWEYLSTHLTAVAEARAAGADVRGYFVWSLLDNFEWAFGYTKRFGIVHVDFATQVSTPKLSAVRLRDHLQGHAVRDDVVT